MLRLAAAVFESDSRRSLESGREAWWTRDQKQDGRRGIGLWAYGPCDKKRPQIAQPSTAPLLPIEAGPILRVRETAHRRCSRMKTVCVHEARPNRMCIIFIAHVRLDAVSLYISVGDNNILE
jgi:hypothetical protein